MVIIYILYIYIIFQYTHTHTQVTIPVVNYITCRFDGGVKWLWAELKLGDRNGGIFKEI